MMLSMMSTVRRVLAPATVAVLLAVLLLGPGACAKKSGKVPAGTSQPDKFLFERGTEQLQKKKWLTAREYFQTLVETYPQSPYRADAKLGVGDCYLGEGTAATSIQAIQEFREFLSFFPTNPRADYAQYKLGMAHFYQMAKPERDQSETKAAIQEFDAFFTRYPNSTLTPEAKKYAREAHDRLSESEYRVGLFYYRAKWYPGAEDRFKAILKNDPEFTGRDAVYFNLADALVKLNRAAEALPLLTKLQEEFVQSEFLVPGQKLMAEIKAKGLETAPAATDATKPADADKDKKDQPKAPEVKVKTATEPKKVPEPAKPGKPSTPPSV
jgi:outer membrane protein assembly factor BamD